MQGRVARGALTYSPSHGSDSGHGSSPAAAPQRRRLTRRPGYMRSAACPGIGFLSPAAGMPCQISAGLISQESHHSQSKAGQCGLDPSSRCQGSLVGSPFLKSSLAPALASVGHLYPAQSSMREMPVHFGAHSRNGNRLPERLTRSRRPGDSGCWWEFLSSNSSESTAPSLDVACSEESSGLKTVDPLASPELNGLTDISALPASQDTFTSSFSFIRLSLGASGERGEAEGCLPSREAESPHQGPQESMAAETSSSDRPHEDPQHPWTFSPQATPGSMDLAQVTGSNSKPDCGMVSSEIGFPSRDPSSAGGPGSSWADTHGWDALLREWEPVLQDYLLRNRRQLEVTSLSLKLQKLQEKAIVDSDYDTAETLRQRLEDLEQEKGRLPWALPSQQPALRSFLSYLAAQTRVALDGATQRAGSDDPEVPLGGEARTTAQGSLTASFTRRDQLILEKQQLQKEIEALQARMSVLEAKEQQLSRELEEQQTVLQWQGCDLMPLVAQMNPGQLQEVSKALGETLTSARQAPFHVEPSEALRSLRERTKSLNVAVREITAQVCSGEKLCSSLRRRLRDLDTRLPALLEAKMLAVSGCHFCTAKELTEEIWALSSEREGLELLLGRLLTLSSRTVRRLGSVKEDYIKCRQDLALQEAVHKASMKASTVKYVEMLEGQLGSCRCPLLGRVWKADLEACQLLMQSLWLQEAGNSPHAEDEKQADSAGEATWTASLADHPRPNSEEEKKAPWQVSQEWSAHAAPLPHGAGVRQQEESYILSAEIGEKCEAIGKRLLHLEDQLHKAVHSHDETLFRASGEPPSTPNLTKKQLKEEERMTTQLELMTIERNELRDHLIFITEGAVGKRSFHRPNPFSEKLRKEHEQVMSDLQNLENEHTEASEDYKGLTKEMDFYRNLHSRLLMEQTQLKKKVDVLKQENKGLLGDWVLLKQHLADLKLLCDDQQEETSSLETQLSQEQESLERRLQYLLKQRDLVTHKKELAERLQRHLDVSKRRFEKLQHKLAQATAQDESLLQKELPAEPHPQQP